MMRTREYLLSHEQVFPLLKASLEDELALDFSRSVLRELSCSTVVEGRVFANIGLTVSELLDFLAGGRLTHSEGFDNWFVSRMINDTDGFWVIENWIARPQDSYLKEMNLPVVMFDEEVYYLVEDWRKEPNWQALIVNRPPLFHAFYVQGSIPSNKENMMKKDFLCLAKRVSSVALGVYDGESFLVCNIKSLY